MRVYEDDKFAVQKKSSKTVTTNAKCVDRRMVLLPKSRHTCRAKPSSSDEYLISVLTFRTFGIVDGGRDEMIILPKLDRVTGK